MPCCLLTGVSAGHDHAVHFVVLLERPDHALKEGLRERVLNNVSRIVSHPVEHVVVQDFAVHPLEAQEVLTAEIRAVPLVEGVDDLGQRLLFLFGVKVAASKRSDCPEQV